jgi:hypothetical protein
MCVIIALGLTALPSFFSPASLHTSTAAAPSLIWLAFPAVILPLGMMVSRVDSFSMVVPARTPSSALCTTWFPSFCKGKNGGPTSKWCEHVSD